MAFARPETVYFTTGEIEEAIDYLLGIDKQDIQREIAGAVAALYWIRLAKTGTGDEMGCNIVKTIEMGEEGVRWPTRL